MSEELKPCPFCGSEAKLKRDPGNEVYGQSWRAKCKGLNCGAKGPAYFGSSTFAPDDAQSRTQDMVAKKNAAAWWNRRC